MDGDTKTKNTTSACPRENPVPKLLGPPNYIGRSHFHQIQTRVAKEEIQKAHLI